MDEEKHITLVPEMIREHNAHIALFKFSPGRRLVREIMTWNKGVVWNGYIWHFAFWNWSLTAAEIAALHPPCWPTVGEYLRAAFILVSLIVILTITVRMSL